MALLHDYGRRAQEDDAGATIQDLLKDIDYENHLLAMSDNNSKMAENRWRNVQELCDWLARKGEEGERSLVDLTQTIALMTLLEGRNGEEIDAVKLSTLHASKGLEYPFVYLVGCEEGILPHADSVEEGGLEEERRLMYVGITRAKQELTLTYCRKRKRMGNWQFPEPSRFIDEMPQQELAFFGRKGDNTRVGQEEGLQ